MDTRVALRDEALMPTTFDGLLKQAQVLVKSGLLPDAVKTPEAAVVIMLKGRELDIPPMQAFASIYVVKGKPTIGAQLMGALILREGHTYHVDELTNERCTITFQRRGGQPYRHEFSIEDAKRAQLAGGDNWQKYTKAMLFSRCMSAGARVAMPDVLAGMYTPEELTDAVTVDEETGEITPGAQVIDAKPALVVTVTTPPAATEPERKPTNGKPPSWMKDKAKADTFMAQAAEHYGLTYATLYEAMGVQSIEQYTGTMADAKLAIEKWLHDNVADQTEKDEEPAVEELAF